MVKTAYIILVIILLFSGCICNLRNEMKELESTTTTIKPKVKVSKTTTTTLKIITTTTTTLRIITKVLYQYNNISLDISDLQRFELMNMKPTCNSASCSDGFFQCKEKTLDVLDLKKSKFKERQSSGVMELIRKQPQIFNQYCFPLYRDNYTEYFYIPKDSWFISELNDSYKIRHN